MSTETTASIFPSTCHLHRFDIKTGTTEDLPNTTGLWTARMCPTGPYVVAESPDEHKLVLYDMRTQQGRKLISFPHSVVGNNPLWSKDGKFVYIDAPQSSDPAIYRIRIADNQRERVVSLQGIQRANTDFAIGQTPDGSFLIPQRVQGSEIYAWDWIAP